MSILVPIFSQRSVGWLIEFGHFDRLDTSTPSVPRVCWFYTPHTMAFNQSCSISRKSVPGLVARAHFPVFLLCTTCTTMSETCCMEDVGWQLGHNHGQSELDWAVRPYKGTASGTKLIYLPGLNNGTCVSNHWDAERVTELLTKSTDATELCMKGRIEHFRRLWIAVVEHAISPSLLWYNAQIIH